MTRLSVRVTPRAAKDAVGGIDADGKVTVRVTAAPADGAANAAVTRLLGKALGLPSRQILLVTGATSREKLFELPITIEEVRRRLTGATGSGT